MTKLAIIVPVFNERDTVAEALARIASLDVDKEIVVVDDGSTDGTRDVLANKQHQPFTVLYHPRNMGKGAAIRTGLAHVTGQYVVVQDADLEYDPQEVLQLLVPLERGECDAAFGNRFPLALREGVRGIHVLIYVANMALALFISALFMRRIHDMETCYKVMRTEVAKSLQLTSDRFEIEPEITAKLLKRGYRIKELPISYRHRHYAEGKKITWRDAITAFLTIIKYRFVD